VAFIRALFERPGGEQQGREEAMEGGRNRGKVAAFVGDGVGRFVARPNQGPDRTNHTDWLKLRQTITTRARPSGDAPGTSVFIST